MYVSMRLCRKHAQIHNYGDLSWGSGRFGLFDKDSIRQEEGTGWAAAVADSLRVLEILIAAVIKYMALVGGHVALQPPCTISALPQHYEGLFKARLFFPI